MLYTNRLFMLYTNRLFRLNKFEIIGSYLNCSYKFTGFLGNDHLTLRRGGAYIYFLISVPKFIGKK